DGIAHRAVFDFSHDEANNRSGAVTYNGSESMHATDNIWQMIGNGGPIDAQALLRALVNAGDTLASDTRSRMLRRDAVSALAGYWGEDLLRRRLRFLGAKRILDDVADAPATDEGAFVTIRERLVDATNPENLLQMLREL